MLGPEHTGNRPLHDGPSKLIPGHGTLADPSYRSRPAPLVRPERIILAKGALESSSAQQLVDSIIALSPQAVISEQLDTPHNQIDLGASDPLELHDRGKKTLVIGAHRSAVRQSSEEGNTCPNYWHFSPYGFCPYRCRYCYLAGTQGVRFSPTVKIFINLEEILVEIDRVACPWQKRHPGERTRVQYGPLGF